MSRRAEANLREREHSQRVGRIFDRVAPVYDPMNRALSLGQDRHWRLEAAVEAALGPGELALDIAVGTADMPLALLEMEPTAQVVGIDPNREMLVRGRRKVAKAGRATRVQLLLGDGMAIPFADQSFDACTIAFGARNVADVRKLIREMARVTRIGGRVVCLEMARPRGRVFPHLYRLYFDRLIPLMGKLLVGRHEEYAYLPDSLDNYLTPGEMTAAMEAAGLRAVTCRELMAGTVTLHAGSA